MLCAWASLTCGRPSVVGPPRCEPSQYRVRPSAFSPSFAAAFSSSPVAARLSSAIDAVTEELRSLDAVVSMFGASDAAPLNASLGTAALSLASSLPARAFAAVAETAAATEARLVSAAARAAALESVRTVASSDKGMDSPLFYAAVAQAAAAGVSTRDVLAAAADAISAASRSASATAANDALLPKPTLPGNWEQAGTQLWFDRDSLLGVGSNSTVVYAGVFARKCLNGYEPVPAAVKRVSITPDVADATAQRIKRDANIGELLGEATDGLVVRPLCVYLDGNDFLVSAAEVRKKLDTPARLLLLSPTQTSPNTMISLYCRAIAQRCHGSLLSALPKHTHGATTPPGLVALAACLRDSPGARVVALRSVLAALVAVHAVRAADTIKSVLEGSCLSISSAGRLCAQRPAFGQRACGGGRRAHAQAGRLRAVGGDGDRRRGGARGAPGCF